MFQHSLVNLWVSYTIDKRGQATKNRVSAFSGESLGELRGLQPGSTSGRLVFQHSLVNLWVSYLVFWTRGRAGAVFQHSLVNLWVSYVAPERLHRLQLGVSAFSGESLGELPISNIVKRPPSFSFSILW